MKKYWATRVRPDRPVQERRLDDRRVVAVSAEHAARRRRRRSPAVIPKEGATGWLDTWMLSAKAKHPNCAYKWMQYISTPKVQAQQAIVLRRDAGEHEGVLVHEQARRRARARSTSRTRPSRTTARSSSGRRRSPTAATARRTAWTTRSGSRPGRRSRASPAWRLTRHACGGLPRGGGPSARSPGSRGAGRG